MKIYLAGDSIVQDYTQTEFIAGWGQYFAKYFKETVQVINTAKGGRSSRLFINEGRLDWINEQMKAGDYLLIEFCHNDDATKPYKTMFNRLVELGPPDENGRYPLIPGERMPKDYIPQAYLDCLEADEQITNKQAVLEGVYRSFAAYPYDSYYPYSENAAMGSYKWFLKQFVDVAREKGAIPVFVTAPARTVFDDSGKIKDGAGLHGGNHFAYIRAMKQLSEEANVALLDLFAFSCELFEEIGQEKIHYLTSIKTGCNLGKWPEDFVRELEKAETVSEDTHFNKYGAHLLTAGLVRMIRDSTDPQLAALAQQLIPQPELIVTEAAPADLR